jgi:hypothetical protein
MENNSSLTIQPGAWPHRPGQYVLGTIPGEEETKKTIRKIRVFPSDTSHRHQRPISWPRNLEV